MAIPPHGTLGKSFNPSVPPARRHYRGARQMEAQGRGQESWLEAGKPWDPHWIQAWTERRLRGLPSSCPAPSGVPVWDAGCSPWLCRDPEPPTALPGEHLAGETLTEGGLDAPHATVCLTGVRPTGWKSILGEKHPPGWRERPLGCSGNCLCALPCLCQIFTESESGLSCKRP